MTDATFDVAFLGLGTMGFPMAGHLAKAGHRVTVYNRTRAKADSWAEKFGGRAAASPAEAAAEADFVFSCVGADSDLREVTLGPQGCFGAMKKGAVFADHTTASAEVARELDQAARERGIFSLDAPVSGGQAGAENGVLTIMVGGPEEAFRRVESVMRCYGRAVTLMGPAGFGQLTKMVNQICVAGVIQGLAEGLAFAKRAGLDGNLVLDVIGKGAAQSWQMDNRGRTMLEDKFDFGFAVDWMRKDLGLAMAEARRNGSTLPVIALIDQFYADVQRMGGNRWDTSSLIKRL